MRKNSKGFSFIFVLPIAVLLGALGYLGYRYYWQPYTANSYDKCFKSFGSTIDVNETGHICATRFNKKFTQALSITENQYLIKADIENIRGLLEIYRSEIKRYPDSLNQLILKDMPAIPLNPLTNKPYSYVFNSDKSDYTISVTFQDGSIYSVNSPK